MTKEFKIFLIMAIIPIIFIAGLFTYQIIRNKMDSICKSYGAEKYKKSIFCEIQSGSSCPTCLDIFDYCGLKIGW